MIGTESRAARQINNDRLIQQKNRQVQDSAAADDRRSWSAGNAQYSHHAVHDQSSGTTWTRVVLV